MALTEKLFGKNAKAMLLPAFLWSLPLVLLSHLLIFGSIFLGLLIAAKQSSDGQLAFAPFVIALLGSIFLTNALYVVFLIFSLRSIAKKIPMDQYDSRLTFCTYVTLFAYVLSTLIVSLLEQEFTFSSFGILPVILMFIIPALYTPKPQPTAQ